MYFSVKFEKNVSHFPISYNISDRIAMHMFWKVSSRYFYNFFSDIFFIRNLTKNKTDPKKLQRQGHTLSHFIWNFEDLLWRSKNPFFATNLSVSLVRRLNLNSFQIWKFTDYRTRQVKRWIYSTWIRNFPSLKD